MPYAIIKLCDALIAPQNALALCFLVATFLLYRERESLRNAGLKLLLGLTILVLALGFFPVGEWLLRPLENRFAAVLPTQVDGIILLAGGEDPAITLTRDTPSIKGTAGRYLRFAELVRLYPKARRVFSGGYPTMNERDKTTPVPEGESNAAVARRVMAQVGIPPESVLYDDLSRNTYENAILSSDLVNPKPQETWLLVTSAWHMPRALSTFRRAGWTIYPAPTDYKTMPHSGRGFHFDVGGNLAELETAVHEYGGLLGYWVLGRIGRLWS